MSSGHHQHLRVWFLLIAILLLGTALRFQAVSTTIVDNPVRADARVYYFSALNLDRWGVFSRAAPSDIPPSADAFVQPGLPFLIAPFVELPPTERMLFHINIVQAILASLTIFLTFALFRTLTSSSLALGASLLVAISPHMIVMTTYLLTETLFTFFLMASMCALTYALNKKNTNWAILAGCLLGLGALTRATTEYLPLFMIPCLYWSVDRRTFVRVVLPTVFVSMAVIFAWKLRNLLMIGHLSDPSLAINTLHHGMYPDFMFDGNPASMGMPYRFDPFTQQINSVGSILQELRSRASEHPLQYAYWYLVGKPIALLSWNMVDGIGDIFIYPVTASPYFNRPLFQATRLIALILHAPLSIAAVAGMMIALVKPGLLGLSDEKRLVANLAAVLVTYFFLIHFVGAPYPRYGIPLRPIIYGFGLFSIVSLLKTNAPVLLFWKRNP